VATREPVDIGFIGLGQIGGPMATRLLGPEVRLHVYDIDEDAMAALVSAGAVRAQSPRAVADAASIVFASLPSREVSEEVALGERGVIHGTAIKQYVETSTLGREAITGISVGLAESGIGCVDAPVTGGVPATKRGTLSIMVSGGEDHVRAVDPWLRKIGGKVTVLGPEPGQAQTMKLVCNLIVAGNLLVACEGLAMGAKAGIDPATMLELLNSGTARSVATSDMLPDPVLRRVFGFGARASIIDKDVSIGLSEANELGAAIPVIATAAEVWRRAGATDLAHEDFTAILKVVEAASATQVGPAAP
jgi:3-hydroxyisobutyrate dehydrogenase-like beta-hydroxyacid dehydrogenase